MLKDYGKTYHSSKDYRNSTSIKVLNSDEITAVSGGISQSTQIGAQMGLIGSGVGLYAAGIALAPFGAALFIGTSLALTGSYLYHNWP
ncbi:hypothetical protein HHX48_08245 [Salinimonas sp. HHU 13199]|uniref:Bacteriocin n=1 Tax=Salinimonas profundi TaxID=2729140 RepID=A0ABR8LK62_9ALTE|nr:hypothetical protein [Salinimonas profundi]MBD3585720.1 hypothetical protein [Salinimonas profundi]